MHRRLVLIGDSSSKRYEYFSKACDHFDTPLEFISYDELDSLQEGDCVKIDPIKITSDNIGDLEDIINDYSRRLNIIESNNVSWYNSPSDILLLLDKYKTKLVLERASIPTTPMIKEIFANYSELYSYLSQEGLTRVFIKPRYGSGASGIVALRYNSRLDEGVIHTTIYSKEGEFFNGKKTYYTNNQSRVKSILDFILSTPVVVEKWLSKKTYDGYNFDLRVVMFKQEVCYIIPRGSNSPITNLHLNNLPLEQRAITNRDEISLICKRVMTAFPELSYAGVDVLVTPKGELFVIEVNAQGDAIYNDFYADNSIYKRQVEAFLLNDIDNKI